MGELNDNIFAKYPNLMKVIENVENEPEIKKWIERRPPKIFIGWDTYWEELKRKRLNAKSN